MLVSAQPISTLAKLFTGLRNNDGAAEFLPAKISWRGCDFYRLNQPVALGDDPVGPEKSGNLKDIPDQVKEACFQESNKVAVNPIRTKVQVLGDKIFEDHIYLVIEIPDRGYHRF